MNEIKFLEILPTTGHVIIKRKVNVEREERKKRVISDPQQN